MAADWSALTSYLRGKPETVTVSWRELADLVGGMPASAIDMPLGGAGPTSHRAWKAAGFEVLARRQGFRSPSVVRPHRAAGRTATGASVSSVTSSSERPLIMPLVLVACVKRKLSCPAARDLYRSARFRKARAYAERRGKPWFIVSAEHGLVAPEEWLAPYERYLPDTPRGYRRPGASGSWPTRLLLGGLGRRTVELHAGRATCNRCLPYSRRGYLERPLEGLTSGRWQGWYDAQAAVHLPAGVHASLFTGTLASDHDARHVASRTAL